MGNQLAGIAGQCCHRSQQDLQFGSKLPKSLKQPKITLVLQKTAKPAETMHGSDFDDMSSQNFESTATTKFNAASSKTSTLAPCSHPKQESIVIVTPEQKEMRVPFNVILLTLSQQLMRVFNRSCQEILGRFMEEGTSASWRLTKKGHYVSVINPTFISLFAQKMFYEGEAIDDGSDSFIPHNIGVLVTEEGIYKGGFADGKAHGNGNFIDVATNTTFKGQWKDGEFVDGSIQNQMIKYTGQIKNSHAQGKGRIIFKKEVMEYVGWFKTGKYEGEDSILKCGRYTYEGNFKEGRKNGRGVLIEKEQKIEMKMGSSKIKKYIPPSTIVGQWENDNIITIISQDLSSRPFTST